MYSRKFQFCLEILECRRLLAAVDIPDVSGNVAEIVATPVNIDTAVGVRAAEIRLNYDTTILDLDSNSVTVGSVWAGTDDTQITANVDDATGTVVIFISASAALPDTSGSLVILNFAISENAAVDAVAAIDLTIVTLNEGGVDVSPAPIPGPDVTDGQILVTPSPGSDRIGGFVFADANLDGLLSPGEAIPGVMITLTNSTTGAQQEATTTADGSYEFVDLAPGSYQLQERQPVAYLDGGANSLDVQLVSNSVVTDQNFVERGLLPQFLYNRLLTTTVQPVNSSAWQAQIVQINTDAESGMIAAPSRTTFVADVTATGLNSSPVTAASALLPIDSTLPQAEGESQVATELMGPTTADANFDAVPMPDDDDERLETQLAAIDQAILKLDA